MSRILAPCDINIRTCFDASALGNKLVPKKENPKIFLCKLAQRRVPTQHLGRLEKMLGKVIASANRTL